MARLHFDAHEVTVRKSESGGRYIVTAESKTQLTAFALRPEVLKSLSAQLRRAVRQIEAEQLAKSDGFCPTSPHRRDGPPAGRGL